MSAKVVTFRRKGSIFPLFQSRRESDPHVVEEDVRWHVLSQLARLGYTQQRRILENVIVQLEERNNQGLTVEDGKTRVALDYSEAQE